MSQLPPPSAAGTSMVRTGGYNTLGAVSLATGVLAIFGHIPWPFFGGGTLALVAIVTGALARGQIRRSGERGMWMANVGLILGILHFALLILFFAAIIFAIFVLGLVMFGHSR